MEKILSRALHPGLLALGIGLSLLGIRAGWNAALLTAAVNLVAAAIVFVLERRMPFAPDWNRARGDLGTDAAHALLSNTIPVALFRALFFGGLVRASTSLASAFGASSLWPSLWPLALQLALALVVAELFESWYHRWLHSSDLGWRLHSVHHSAERLYWLNGLRGHPLDLLASFLVQQAPLVLLGATEPVIVLVTGFIGINGVLKHSNVLLRGGPLNWLLSTAELHRWHHSPVLAEAQCNYGNNLIVWDLLFGTRSLPAGRQPPTDIGIPDMPAFPRDYLGQLLAPFRFSRLRQPV